MEQFFAAVADDLILNVRQSAWLTSQRERPEDDKETKDRTLPSRLEQQRTERRDPNFTPELPPTPHGDHILEYLFDVGPILQTGMGAIPVTHGELRNWAEDEGIAEVLTPWERKLIVQLSKEYFAELHRARQVDCPEPWDRSDQSKPKKPPMTPMQRRLRAIAGV